MEQLTIYINKRHQAVAEAYLSASGFLFHRIQQDEERGGFEIEYDEAEKMRLLELLVLLIWLQEQKKLLDWTEQGKKEFGSRWERIKFRRQMADSLEEDLSILHEAVRADLMQVCWSTMSLDITGFVRFAAGHLRCKLMEIGKELYTQYQEEKERSDFAEVLQNFVRMQEPVVAVADVLWSETDFEVRDEKGCDLKSVYWTSMLLERIEEPEDATPEDLLLSILITVVPAQVVIHRQGTCTKESLAMVERVFEDRLFWCTGCGYCQ